MRTSTKHQDMERTSLIRSLGGSAVLVAMGAVIVAMLAGASGAATTAAPTNTGEPAITGTPQEGQRLTSTTGSWSGTQPMTFARRWLRCGVDGGKPDGSNCLAIPNATARRYVLQAADVGFRLRVRVTATNADGSATVASNATTKVTAAPAVPTNTTEPTIAGTPVVGNRLTVNRGAWTGDQPITYSFRWLRCNTAGDNCSEIAGATDTEYVVVAKDVGRTLRVRVTAKNDQGSRSALANPTAVVQKSTPTPGSSIPVTDVPNTARLIVSDVRFTPNPVRSKTGSITVSIRVKDTRGNIIRGALVFIRSTPRVTSGGDRQATGNDGWVTYKLVPNANFPKPRNGFNVQFFVKAYRAGDPPLAGIAAYRLVQVRLAG
jgi:hypothetical protein